MAMYRNRPFTRAEALAAGLSDRELRGFGYQRVFHGVYFPATAEVGTLERAQAALHVSPPGTYVSCDTAAALWGAAVNPAAATHVTVVGAAHRVQRRGIVVHRNDQPTATVTRYGVLVSTPAQTFLELAAERKDLVDLVAVGDALVKAKRITPEELVTAASTYQSKGARLARRAASFVRPDVDSPMETRTRMLVVLAGLSEPVVNYILRDAYGEPIRRFDLCFAELKLIIQYDGRHHNQIRGQWLADLKRREELEELGWRFVVVTAEALYGDARGTLARIIAALEERGCRDLPRRVSPEWQRLFDTRQAAA